MKRFLTSAGSALILATVILPAASQAAASHAAMSIKVVSSNLPHQVSMKQLSHLNLSVTVKSSGVLLNARRLGKTASGTQGHVQVYLDRVPADAYRKADLKQDWVLSTAAQKFSFRLLPAFLHGKAGQHKLIFALAKNNNVLYNAPATSVSFTVK